MKINAFRYSKSVFEEDELSSLTEIKDLMSDTEALWIDVNNPESREDLAPLEKILGLHPLALDDCINIRQRPKVEDYGDNLFIILRGVDQDSDAGRFSEGMQLGIIFGKNFAITVHKTPIPLQKIKENLKRRKPSSDLGVSILVYIILDLFVDSFEAQERVMEERVRKVEDEVLRNPTKNTLTEIFTNRQNILLLRKMIRPQRDAVSLLVEGGHPLIHSGVSFYLRDVFDHAERTMDGINTLLDITNGSLDIYLSSISNRMNAVIKVLTMINTIFMPLTLVIGLYTITFPAPYPKWETGPLFILFIIIILSSFMFAMFRKIRWI